MWTDQTGGRLVWDKEANTLTFNNFHYDVADNKDNYASSFSVSADGCSIILNGTSVI